MTTKRAITAGTARKIALEECLIRMKSAFRRGLEATCTIAKELHKIYREELYFEVTEDFNEFVTDYLNINIATYRRIIAVSQTVHQLQEAGLELPANESQVAELARLDPPIRARVWNELVIRAEKEDKVLTVEDIRRAVEVAEQAALTRDTRGPSDADHGVEVDLDMDANGAEPSPAKKKAPVQEAVLVLTEKGEAALTRVRKVCGDEIAEAIASGTKAMTERDLRNWAEYDNEMMRQLVFFVFDQGYPLSKAVNFISKGIDDSTDVHDLILIASSRGGTAMINHDRAKIVIELKST
jgi:hypothetical protein